MAQAARLNLRMQKELKLLLTDPPPGASFPLLSRDTDTHLSTCSLSSIDAQIEGPEGTVYAEGTFNIKIQIPERYPFQPPIVTFATPIYHPNIDTGGRICLDILNLPPKGAWQPSLNISTVLTSIGLLLSEPNPDDGLMCEASREYKYNRQAFDQKARSMTEKYANAGAIGNSSSIQSIQTNSNPTTMEVKRSDAESKYEVNEYIVSHNKLCGISRKLSLDSSGSTHKTDGDGEVNETCHLSLPNFENQTEVKGPTKETKGVVDEYNLSHEKLCGTRRKLSLESWGQSQKRDGDDKENVVPNHCQSLFNPQSLSTASSECLSAPEASNRYDQQPHQDQDSESINYSMNMSSKKLCQVGQKLSLESPDTCQTSDANNEKKIMNPQLSPSQSCSNASHTTLPMPQAVNHDELQPHKDPFDRTGNVFTNTKCKKLCSVGKKLSLRLLGSSQRQEKDDKENAVPTHKLLLSHSQTASTAPPMSSLVSRAGEYYDGRAKNCGINVSHKKFGMGRKLSLEPLGQLKGSNDDNSQLFSHHQNLSTATSKSLPMPQDCRFDEKLQSNQDRDGKICGGIKECGKEDSRIAETVIVLDSEDSEDERNGSLKSKLPLGRKRLAGKWRTEL